MTTSLAERLARDEQAGNHPYIRPKDAATLLILDRSGADVRVLMGRRHMRHTFMPGKFVFPGGRVDATDSRVRAQQGYHPVVEEKLRKELKAPKSDGRIRGFALAAIRETYEEAGVFVGSKELDCPKRLGAGFDAFVDRGIALDLTPLRFIARAITPPKRPRRFDARFFAVWSDAIAEKLADGRGPSGELEDCAWLTLEEARQKELPMITQTILTDLENRLETDPELAPETDVPFYSFRQGDFVRDLL